MYHHSMEKTFLYFFFLMDFFFPFYSMHLLSKEATIHFIVNFGQLHWVLCGWCVVQCGSVLQGASYS